MQRRQRRLRALGAAVLAAAAVAAAPGLAHAEFGIGFRNACEGAESITGIGSALQEILHWSWGAALINTVTRAATRAGFGYDLCAAFKLAVDGGTKSVSYDPAGDVAGLRAVGAKEAARNVNYAFAATDDPPESGEITRATENQNGLADDDSQLLTVPIAQKATAIGLHLPTGCSLPTTGRFLTAEALEGAFRLAAAYDTWGEITPEIRGAGCAAKTFTRVVRLDEASLTWHLKRYLFGKNSGTVEGRLTWSTLGNTRWPSEGTRLARGAANGNASQLTKLSEAGMDGEGAIGYSELSRARAATPSYGWSGDADRYIWAYLFRIGGGMGPFSPAASSDAESPAADRKGANCADVEYEGIPSGASPGAESWRSVSAFNAELNYPLCSPMYALAWADGSNAGIPQAKQRAAKDYLTYLVTLGATGGQRLLLALDFAPSNVFVLAARPERIVALITY